MLPETTGLELTVSQFVALLNQTLEYAYPEVVITGELANLRVSRNRWLYFDLKDANAAVKFFGTVYNLPGPLEDGMLLKVRGQPRLHPLYGFSVNVVTIQPAGEGTIKRAAQLLQAKLAAEGLFDEARKRSLLYPPRRLGLITAKQSAAYGDFIKVLNHRWRGLEIDLIDVQVQGETAPAQIAAAIEHFNELAVPPEVLVVIRGGGSTEDLAAFSTEVVTRAVAASRVPTLIAIGHEADLALAELAADRRASTPSNAAELLVPDRRQVLAAWHSSREHLGRAIDHNLQTARAGLQQKAASLDQLLADRWQPAAAELASRRRLLAVLNPQAVLQRGYAIVHSGQQLIQSSRLLKAGNLIEVRLAEGGFSAEVVKTRGKSAYEQT